MKVLLIILDLILTAFGGGFEMTCRNCGHMKRCHTDYAHIGNKGCRLASPICMRYERSRRWHRHYMQDFYDSLGQGEWWRKQIKRDERKK